MNVSVIGLGKLGLCTAACIAAKGHKVVGVDTNEFILKELNAKRCPIRETGLEGMLDRAWTNLDVRKDHENAVLDSDITLIIVPTPSLSDGTFSSAFVKKALASVAPALKRKKSFHVVDIVSTVMPGSCETFFKPLLEGLTEKKCGEEFGLVYNPEFIALGSVIKNFLNPDLVLIGTSDERSGMLVKKLYEETCENHPVVSVMSLINAEITKLSINCYVTMKISFANNLAAICEQVAGANVDIVTTAVGTDTRVGKKNIRGGLGFGGPCFPRDNLAFQAFARQVGIGGSLSRAVVEINDQVVKRLYERIERHFSAPGKVALLGLSYKPETHIIEESQSIHLANLLVNKGYQVAVHDPQALQSSKDVFGGSVEYFEDPYDCVNGARVIALLTDWPIYRNLDWDRISRNLIKGALVIDSWRVLERVDGQDFISSGVGVY